MNLSNVQVGKGGEVLLEPVRWRAVSPDWQAQAM